MDIPLGHLRRNISMSRAPERREGWEELPTIGMDDLELARLNQTNTRDPVHAPCEGVRLVYGPHRNP